MKVIIRNFLFLIVLVFSISQLQAIEVSVSSLCYYQEKGYVEIYSRIMGSSVTFVSIDDVHKMGNVELLVIIKKGERISIAEKFNIDSPNATENLDFWDMKRYVLDPGAYQLSLQYVDLNNTSDTLSYKESITINSSTEKLLTSDLLLLSEVSETEGSLAFHKAGR